MSFVNLFWFLHALQDSYAHFFSSVALGLSVVALTWIMYCSAYGMEPHLVGKIWQRGAVAHYIFRQSLLVGCCASLVMHGLVDYWPVIRKLVDAI